jgi:hypothetical protein
MIVLSDEKLRVLERRFGPDVRQMGSWNTDGSFGFCAVPVAVLEEAAQAVGSPTLTEAIKSANSSEDRAMRLIEFLEAFGSKLVEAIVASYHEHVARAYRRPLARTANG